MIPLRCLHREKNTENAKTELLKKIFVFKNGMVEMILLRDEFPKKGGNDYDSFK